MGRFGCSARVTAPLRSSSIRTSRAASCDRIETGIFRRWWYWQIYVKSIMALCYVGCVSTVNAGVSDEAGDTRFERQEFAVICAMYGDHVEGADGATSKRFRKRC